MSEAVVWLIIAAFYAPLHFGGPVGVAILTSEGVQYRQRMVRHMLVDSAVSMLLAFMLVIWLARDKMQLAMMVMLLSMAVPYVMLFIHRCVLKRPDPGKG